MRCPNCKCEVGSQKMCPYCGVPMEAPDSRLSSRTADYLNRIYRHVRSVDSNVREQNRKINILLVFACGNLAMTILLLIALMIK